MFQLESVAKVKEQLKSERDQREPIANVNKAATADALYAALDNLVDTSTFDDLTDAADRQLVLEQVLLYRDSEEGFADQNRIETMLSV